MINGLLHALVLDGQGGARPIGSTNELNSWQPSQGKPLIIISSHNSVFLILLTIVYLLSCLQAYLYF